MPRVKFINVGREKKNWEAECEGDLTYQWLFGQVKKQRALVSNDIDFYKDGRITAGFRTVGRFEIVKVGESKS